MNNPTNLFYYSQLLLFKSDISRAEIVFADPDNLQQRTLHDFADGFGLAYEYSRQTTEVRITRSEDLHATDSRWTERSLFAVPAGLNIIPGNDMVNEWLPSDLNTPSFADPQLLHSWPEDDSALPQFSGFDVTGDSSTRPSSLAKQPAPVLESWPEIEPSIPHLNTSAREEEHGSLAPVSLDTIYPNGDVTACKTVTKPSETPLDRDDIDSVADSRDRKREV
jgi:hypothetical protein